MRIPYWFGQHDFGAGSEIFWVMGPKGKRGKLVDYGIQHVTETFTNTTTPGYVSVGSASDADAYGEEIDLGTTAADVGGVSARTLARGDGLNIEDYILDAGLGMPADTKVGLHCTAPTGGTPAGIAHVFMIIDWED